MIWITGFLFPYTRRDTEFGPFEMLTIALPISMIAGGFLSWRIVRIYRLFVSGQIVRGWILSLRIIRDRGRLEFAYEIGGRSYAAWTPVHRTKQVLSLRQGDEVEILVDASFPTHAIVRSLYVDSL